MNSALAEELEAYSTELSVLSMLLLWEEEEKEEEEGEGRQANIARLLADSE